VLLDAEFGTLIGIEWVPKLEANTGLSVDDHTFKPYNIIFK